MMPRRLARRAASIVAIPLLFLIAACTPTQVQQAFAARGVAIDAPTATAISAELNRPKAWHERCHGSGPDYIECLIRARWAGTGQADQAVRIARRESGLNPNAKNRASSASGVFQCLAIHWRGRFNPFDPIANIDYSFRLWQESGWRPWALTRD